MRWILPLLSLALVPSAFGEIAVYTGLQVVQNASNAGGSSIVRVADVIDLATGNIVTVGLSGGHTDFSYAVGPEVPYVVAKTTDGHGHGLTAFAQASTDTDSTGSKFALAATLRGRDATVTLSAAGSSQWPRTLLGLGSLVAAAGTDPVTTPASASYSTIALTLNETWSKAANASGGTLTQAAEVVAQQFRNRAATLLKVTPSNNNVVSGVITSGAITSGGLTKSGAGTLLFGSTSNSFVGAVTINQGTLRLDPGSPFIGSVTTTNGGTVVLNGGTLTTVGGTIAGGATLTLGGAQSTGGVIQRVGGLTSTGGGTLVLTGANQFTGGTLVHGTLTGGVANTINLTYPLSTINLGSLTNISNLTNVTGSGASITFAGGGDLVLQRGPTTINPNLILTSANAGSITNTGFISNAEVTNVVSGATTLTFHSGLSNVVVTQPLSNILTVTGNSISPSTTTLGAAVPGDQ